MRIDSILFDLDGTLWDSVDGILITWNRVLQKYPGLRAPIDRVEQESLMGLQMDTIAQRLFPGQSAERQLELMQECMAAENAYLYEHGGTLYPAVPETLEALHQSHKLFIVSNCQSGYIEAFLHAHGLEQTFDGRLCFGDTGDSKGENIRAVVGRNHLKNPVYVGDTQGDLESAEYAGVPFVYAKYGFGAVTRYDMQISYFRELLDLFG